MSIISFRSICLFIILTCNASFNKMCAQSDTARFRHTTELGSLVSSNQTPFLLKIGQFGVVPNQGATAFLRLATSGRISKLTSAHVQIDYGAEVIGNINQNSQLLLPEAFVRAKGKWWELWTGRRKQFYGLGDTLLSSGSFTFSTNSLPMPRIHIGTPGFVPVPFTNRFVAIHAMIAHGWFGEQDSSRGVWLHHKSFYIRVGKPRFRVTGGMTHAVQWGGESKFINSPNSSLTKNGKFGSSWSLFLPYVLLPGKPNEDTTLALTDRANALGNHLGSVDISFEGQYSNWSWLFYLQRPFEDKSGAAQQNWPDGLYGLRLIDRRSSKRTVIIRRFTVEYIHTMDQSGPIPDFLSTTRYGGQDDYFNHNQYTDGWTYRGNLIGTPFVTLQRDIPVDRTQVFETNQRFAITNNRVRAFYLTLLGNVGPHSVETRFALSRNFGRYASPFITPIWQSSGLVRVNWQLGRTSAFLVTALSFDSVGIFNQSIGGWFSIRKTWGG